MFNLGTGANVEFSTMVSLDSTWKSLVDNTPYMSQRDDMNVVTLRFPRYNETLLYDPTIKIKDKVSDPPKSSSTSIMMMSNPSLLFALIVYGLTAILVVP